MRVTSPFCITATLIRIFLRNMDGREFFPWYFRPVKAVRCVLKSAMREPLGVTGFFTVQPTALFFPLMRLQGVSIIDTAESLCPAQSIIASTRLFYYNNKIFLRHK